MKWKIGFVMIIVLVIGLYFVVYEVRNDMKYNNTDSKEVLITERYSASEIMKLQQCISYRDLNFDDLQSKFKIQCLRKTHQGYYIILKQNDESNVFIFMSDELIVDKILVFSEDFKSKDKFKNYVVTGMSKDKVALFDTCNVTMPISAIDSVAHYVEEGVFILTYARKSDKNIVNKIYFYNDEEHVNAGNDSALLMIPYILEIDRINDSSDV